MDKTVIILVGPSGCGKSSWANSFVHEALERGEAAVVCSADDSHMYDDGAGGLTYVFNPAKAPMAHSDCMNKFIKALADQETTYIVVDNTNISRWERQNYAEAARLVGAELRYEVWKPLSVNDIKTCAARNAHGVPQGVIADMALRFDFDPGTEDAYRITFNSI